MKGPNLSSRIFKKSAAGGPEAEEIVMEFNAQVPKELHCKILEYHEKWYQVMTTAHITTIMVTTSCQNQFDQCFLLLAIRLFTKYGSKEWSACR